MEFLPSEIQSQPGAVQFAAALGLAIAGMLLVNWLFRMDMFGFAWRAARKRLPVWAAAHGLQFELPALSYGMGSVRGVLGGRTLVIQTDNAAVILIHFRTEVSSASGREVVRHSAVSEPFELSTIAPKRLSRDAGADEFSTGNRVFDGFFQTRLGTGEVGARLRAASDLHRFVETEFRAAAGGIKYCQVDNECIRCRVLCGNSSRSYFPEHKLEQLVPALLQLADRIETAVSQPPC